MYATTCSTYLASSTSMLSVYFYYYSCSNAGSDSIDFGKGWDRKPMLTREATYLLR